ncbi:hypothetical protein ZIOFF_001673 [Zingiber officinale]|uniref:Uncharacterized protein n=1 Tax=Zingiber officinale TaxID=94328 RepID=A0A8J5IKD8_ZINOF|nr:hypothetical protein ZIOFF_001673 [Zingiber officinale]
MLFYFTLFYFFSLDVEIVEISYAVSFRYFEGEWMYSETPAKQFSLQISSTPELKLMKCGSSGLNACEVTFE